MICVESMFGENLGKLVAGGGELIVVITNDGWWKKNSGAVLHFRISDYVPLKHAQCRPFCKHWFFGFH